MSSNRYSLIVLFGTLVVVMMGFGMVIPLLGFYVKRFFAGGAGPARPLAKVSQWD